MILVKSEFNLKCYNWSSDIVLESINQDNVTFCPEVMNENRKKMYWHDMCSEYDSLHLFRYLTSGQSKIEPSRELFELMCFWHLDEQNHFRGLKKINKLLYDYSDAEIRENMMSREITFEPIEEFLSNEFTFLVSLAFDEVTSARAYNKDRKIYNKMNNESLKLWLKYAARDEAAHYGNAITLLRKKYPYSKPDDIWNILNRIVEMETQEDYTYYNTFIFDHDTEDFSPELLNDSANTIINLFEPDH